MTTTYDTFWGAELGDALKVLADVATCCDELATASPEVIRTRLDAIDAAYDGYMDWALAFRTEYDNMRERKRKQFQIGFTAMDPQDSDDDE